LAELHDQIPCVICLRFLVFVFFSTEAAILTGFLLQLGNPLLEYATDFNSRAEFFWSHGLISDSTYKMFTAGCNYSRYVSEYYRNSILPLCSKVMSQVSRETSKFVDKYDVTLDVCIYSVLSQFKAICPQNHVSLLF
jgi:serine carboxypeptidase-like clade 2